MRPEPINPTETHAFFEQVEIQPGHSFLWRVDDYPWERNVWNYHPEFEIHLIRHSSGLAYVGDHIGQFEAGHLYLVGSDLPHNWITPYIGDELLEARDIVLQFDPHVFLNAANGFPELKRVEEMFAKAARGLEFIGDTRDVGRRILESMDGSGSLADLSKMIELLSVLSRSEDVSVLSSEAFSVEDHIKGVKDHKVIEAALDYLQRNFLDSPSLKEVAEVVGMSESAFSRFFKSKTGNTFSEHMTSLRLWMAGKLLLETDDAITSICFEAGFNNIANFNRTFLRKTGMTPSKYRKASRQRNLSKQQERSLSTFARD
ncbi:AraC family transcriptional regulator [Shimia sagamensis]|uniref:AraC-type DNA-binding protein n=1 Tax=Shimia sagamensis TaxID=1566352 RepID=A0ABY1NXK4_9RHOB|nr:AraC family transcriptional regulator [Shimia sagamensis]SMP18628.1 AraC-type DNA-binding protein [Shimia sagamensis]